MPCPTSAMSFSHRAKLLRPFRSYRRVVELVKRGKSGDTLVWDSIALALAQREAGQAAEVQKNRRRHPRRTGEKSAAARKPGAGQWITSGRSKPSPASLARPTICLRKVRAAGIKDANDTDGTGGALCSHRQARSGDRIPQKIARGRFLRLLFSRDPARIPVHQETTRNSGRSSSLASETVAAIPEPSETRLSRNSAILTTTFVMS